MLMKIGIKKSKTMCKYPMYSIASYICQLDKDYYVKDISKVKLLKSIPVTRYVQRVYHTSIRTPLPATAHTYQYYHTVVNYSILRALISPYNSMALMRMYKNSTNSKHIITHL